MARKKQRNFTAQSILVLESMGFIVQNVETWNAFAGVKNDLLGFADLIAFAPLGISTILIQVTDHINGKARFNKIVDSLEAFAWLNEEHRIILILTWKDSAYRLKRVTVENLNKKRFADQIKLMKKREELAKIKVKELGYNTY